VLRLSAGPHTAARGRQAGFEWLLEREAGLPYVQFLDGDSVLEPGWLEAAVGHLEGAPGIAAVSGRCREAEGDGSFYARLLDVDWRGSGEAADHFGGNCLMRASALRQAGGWATGLVAGEDPDLSFHLRNLGWQIAYLREPMAVHHAGMTRFAEYWRRAVRSGHAYAEVGWKHRKGAGRPWAERALGNLVYGALLPAAVVLLAFAHWSAGALSGLALAGCFAAIALLYTRLFVRLLRHARGAGASWETSVAYALLNLVCKVANALGALRFAFGRISGRRATVLDWRASGLASKDAERASGAGHARHP
jgi:cellulose synthase/poly-beta-1,6-N-acetylglucosamine synthase-like glycosyltransferase